MCSRHPSHEPQPGTPPWNTGPDRIRTGNASQPVVDSQGGCIPQRGSEGVFGPYGFILFQYELIWRQMDSFHDLLAISEYTPVPLSHGYLWDLLARVYQLVSKWFGNNFPQLPIRGARNALLYTYIIIHSPIIL